ncbi:type IV pilus biogenesis protein PilP [Komagataeibacter sp. FNDCR2]|uniref:type IV pilus biogenesis protein PilP n=1 Tax=Komagataeibacter sp. FNDCR2 TaxID=2878682 RepID=UPI001E508B83|nr:type IV pilus biogenesis protein PilP [Komagataeibacter sp. FNDCR2]MCE2576662.1 type IV pilus biogenesis protein PilP [Komagataeibacter sp. FNDCR2]
MKLLLLAACCAAVFPGAAVASSAIPLPVCASHLAESPIGGVMTQDQIDANNSCIMTLQQDTAIAEAAAKIEDANRRAAGKPDKPENPLRAYSSPASPVIVTPQPSPPPLPPHREEKTAAHSETAPLSTPATPVMQSPPLPVVDGIMWDGSTYTAILMFPDGSSMEVKRGTTLPDGSTIAIVAQSGVYTENNNIIRPLRSASGKVPVPPPPTMATAKKMTGPPVSPPATAAQ